MNTTNKVGRPTDYTPELGEEICDTIACQAKGYKKLYKEHEHWPNHTTFYRWLTLHKEFQDSYVQAKRFQVEVLMDELLAIADDSSNDYIDENDKVIANHEHIARSRLRIDTRKWIACKLLPRVYGDRIQTDITVKDRDDIQKIRDLVNKYQDDKKVA